MTDYTLEDLKILKEDSDNNPTSFTPLFEVPGEIYNQDYPRRLKHTFPKNGKWSEKVEFNGKQIEKWKKLIFNRYVDV